MLRYLILSTYLLLLPFLLYSQKDSIHYSLQTSFLLSSNDRPPYWLVSNQRGKYSVEKYQSLTSGEIGKTTNHSKQFDYGFGLEVVNRYDTKKKLWLQQGYGEVKYSIFKLTAGTKNEVFGVHDTLMSSGSFIWSKNARPIPKITLSTPRFIEVPFTKELVEFSALLSHGWFEKDRYVENPLLHHKNVYLLFGRKLPIEVIAGFDHFAMWGGKSSDPKIGKIPSDWDAFKKVIVAQSYSSIDINERNAFGNHIGAYHLGIKYKFKNNSIFVYKQHPYEDKSGLRLRNWEDGLWGISAKLNNRLIKGAIYEYINTKDQGIEGIYTGRYDPDNYFNNYMYQNGWTIYKQVIGNPIIRYKDSNTFLSIFDNMLQAHYLGINGQYKKICFLLNYQLVNSYGNIFDQYENPKKQSTYFIQTSFPIRGKISMQLTLSYEHGDLYGNNTGLLIKLCYRGFNHL